jgi:hypothetical protein
MRPRIRYYCRNTLAALAASVVVSCATGPPRRNDTPAILEMRAGYLEAHPAGRFNAEIARGEIVVGMGFYDVLAAWGLPDARAAADSSQECWTYVLRDDNEVDWIRYDFLFAQRVVVEWETSRNTGSGFLTIGDDARGVSLRVPPAPTGSFGDGSPKTRSGSSLR